MVAGKPAPTQRARSAAYRAMKRQQQAQRRMASSPLLRRAR
jgi:hypothetical protein